MSSTAAEPLLCRLLGDPMLVGPSGPIRIRSPLQRALLLRLAAAHGAIVGRSELVSALWPSTPPRTSQELLSTHAARLRALLGPHLGSGDEAVPRSESGYRLDLTLVRVDVAELSQAVVRAAESEPARLAEAREALGWLGPKAPAHQAGQPWLVDAVNRAWDDAREICRLNAEVAETRWNELLPALDLLVERAPFDEPVLGWRLEALGRTGRVAEALRAMDEVRRRLRDELGASPSAALSERFDRILRLSDAPTSDPTAQESGTPQQVPPPRSDFTGRTAQLIELTTQLRTPERGTPRHVLITGAAGVGKSALATKLGEVTRAAFPDGQCYIDFTDGAEHEVDLSTTLTAMLRQWGLSESEIPERLPDQLTLLRSVTADLAVLWVLDNVGSRHSVSGLFPTSETSALIVTSRSIHPDLVAAHRCDLPGLSSVEARELLAGITGAERLDREPGPTSDLVDLCEGLPWALHLSGRQLVMHPHRSVARLVSRLSDSATRLDDFSIGGGLRSALRYSVDQLGPESRRAFAALGLLRTHRAQTWMVSNILGVSDDVAAELLEDLVEARLIEEQPSVRPDDPDRSGVLAFTISDLVREYALERWQETDRQAAARSVPGERQMG